MKFVAFFTLFLTTSQMSFAGENLHCFKQHLVDAIKINNIRKPLYSKLTNGKSKSISNNLVALEKLLLLPSKYFDKKAILFQENQIPFLCTDLISMDLTPPFSSEINPPDYSPEEIKLNIEEFKKLLNKKEYSTLESMLLIQLKEVEKIPHFYCLTRHLLESIIRTIRLMPIYIETAENKGIKSPEKLISQYLELHLIGLNIFKKLDVKAIPIQKMGVPILCQDVPPISIEI